MESNERGKEREIKGKVRSRVYMCPREKDLSVAARAVEHREEEETMGSFVGRIAAREDKV